MSVKSDLVLLGGSILAVIGVAISAVMGILVLNGFKSASNDNTNATGTWVSQTNNTIDAFIAGIVIVGTFMEIIMLVLVATIIIRLAKQSGGD